MPSASSRSPSQIAVPCPVAPVKAGAASVVGGGAPLPASTPPPAIGSGVLSFAGIPTAISTWAVQPAPELATTLVSPLSDASGWRLILNVPAASLWVVNVSGVLPSTVIEMSTAALAGNPVAEMVRGLPMGADDGAVKVQVAAALGPTV